MGLHKSQDLYFPTIDGNVKRTGGASKLAMGQLAVVDLSKGASADGAFVVDDFGALSKRSKLEFRLGKANVGVTRSLDNKPYTSIAFSLNDVVDLRVDAPKTTGIGVDDFIIGFNGVAGSEISLDNGDNEVFQLSLTGKAMEYLGYKDGCATVQFQLEAPNEGVKDTDWTDHEIVEKAVEVLKRYELIGQVKLTDYVDVIEVRDTAVALAGGTQFYELTIADNSTFSDLARVQAQYPGNDVKVKSVNEGSTTYITIATALPAAYTVSIADLIKGCEDCPAGYTEFADGFVYQITAESDGVDQAAAIEGAIPGAEAGSGAAVGDEDGKTIYTVVTDDALTDVEIETFLANATFVGSTLLLIAADVSELCNNATTTDTAWIAGEECTASTENYTITLADDECGNNRLEELQAAFPDLTITAGVSVACQTTYSTTIATNVICDECDIIFTDIFSSEAPVDYDLVPWIKEATAYVPGSLMGIRFRAKENILSGSESFRDDMDFVAESVRLSLVGGFPTNVNESYNLGTNGRYTVKLLSRFEPPVNFGGNLRNFEDMGQVYFRGTERHKGNNYAKFVFGEETRLDGTKQYVDYIVTIEPSRLQGGVTQRVNESRTYHVYVEVGRHQEVEGLLNDLAVAAGIPPVQAYAKDA